VSYESLKSLCFLLCSFLRVDVALFEQGSSWAIDDDWGGVGTLHDLFDHGTQIKIAKGVKNTCRTFFTIPH